MGSRGAGAGGTQPSVGDLVQVPWARKLWCAVVVAVPEGSNKLVVNWHGFPNWKQNRIKMQGIRYPLPQGASCVGTNRYCPSHHLVEHWAHCSMEPGCPCELCHKSRHSDNCFVCGKGGKVLMCDAEGCPKVAHIKCVGLREVPVGHWWCPACCPPPETLPWARNSKPNVISLFDGIGIGRQALLQLGMQQLGGYHAFEISQNAIRVANYNHSDITQQGDVREVGCVSVVCCTG